MRATQRIHHLTSDIHPTGQDLALEILEVEFLREELHLQDFWGS
jgi:hypothetical protein